MEFSHQKAEQFRQEGLRLARDGRHVESIAAFRASLAFRPGQTDVFFSLGLSLGNLKRWDDAAGMLRRAVDLEPGNTDYRLWLGLTLDNGWEHRAAFKEYKAALAIEPGNAELHNLLADNYRYRLRACQALKHYRKAVELKPSFAEGWADLGRCQCILSNYSHALASYEMAFVLTTSRDWALPGFIDALGQAGFHARSIKLATDFTRRFPDHSPAWGALGDAFRHRAKAIPEEVDYLHAIRAYEKGLLCDGQDTHCLHGLGSAYCSQGRYDLAVECQLRILVLYPRYRSYVMLALAQLINLQAAQAFGSLGCGIRRAVLPRWKRKFMAWLLE